MAWTRTPIKNALVADGLTMSPSPFSWDTMPEAILDGLCWVGVEGAVNTGAERDATIHRPDYQVTVSVVLTGVPVDEDALLDRAITLDQSLRHTVTQAPLVQRAARTLWTGTDYTMSETGDHLLIVQRYSCQASEAL